MLKFNKKSFFLFTLTCLVTLFFILFNPIYPKEKVRFLDKKDFSISFFEDKNSENKLDNLQNKNFRELKHLKKFFSDSTFWFKIILSKSKSNLEENLYLTLENPTIDNIKFFRFEKGKWVSTITGDSKPFGSREIEDRNFIFKIKRNKDRQTYYIKIRTHSSLLFPINISTKEEYEKNKKNDSIFYTFFYFFILLSFSFALFLPLFCSFKGVFLYIGFKVCLTYVSLVLSGLGFQIIFPKFPFFQNEALIYFLIFYFFLFFYFFREYFNRTFSLGVNGTFPYKILIGTSFILILTTIFVNKWWFFPYFIIPAIVYSSYNLFFYIRKFKPNFELSLINYSLIFLFGCCIIHVFLNIGNLKEIYILKNIIFVGFSVKCILFLAFIFFCVRKKLRDEKNKTRELGKVKDDLFKKTDDLTSFSNLLMKTIEDLETALKELEDANKIKTSFISNISHEIKTPLNAIIGFSEILKTAYNSEAQRDYLQSISESGVELNQTLDKIIDISRIESGELIIKKAPLDVDYLEKLVLEGYSDVCEEKGLEFKFNVERGSIESIEIDPFRIEELIHSIISNAIKFTEKGTVEVDLQLKKENDNANLIFKVKDTGIGISTQNLEKVFKPFYKVESDIKGKTGLGLGLSLVDAIVTQMKGSIKIKSEEGAGTDILVDIPKLKIFEGFKKTDINNKKKFNGEIVAIIDENKFSMEHLKVILEDFNLKVLTFSSIEEFSGYISFSEANLVLIQRELSSYSQFLHLKMFPLKEIPVLKILLTKNKLEDSIYPYDEPLNIYSKILKKIKTNLKNNELKPFEKINVKNKENLIEKLDYIQDEYQRLRDLMEINQIEEFAIKIKKISEEHSIAPLEKWAEELILKTRNFEIDSIEDLLDKYLVILKKLKE